MSDRIAELGEALVSYLAERQVRMTWREIADLLGRAKPAPSAEEIDAVVARLRLSKRLKRVGTVKAVPDRHDGVYCLPDREEGRATVGPEAPGTRRFSVARGAPSSDLTRRSPPLMVEGHGGIKAPRKADA